MRKLSYNRATGHVDRDAPFLVTSDIFGRTGIYTDEPAVVAQFAPDEREARFHAEWKDEAWVFGRRVTDA